MVVQRRQHDGRAIVGGGHNEVLRHGDFRQRPVLGLNGIAVARSGEWEQGGEYE
jgi:hypothetical protein